MGQILHGSATTTEAIRRAIQNSQESLRALAEQRHRMRDGSNALTSCLISFWRSRPEDSLCEGRLLDELKKAFAERALNAEIDHHLNNGEEDGRPNSRNGYGRKSVLTETAKIELEVPRDQLSTFDPQLIAKYQRRFPGFDEKIVSMYARG